MRPVMRLVLFCSLLVGSSCSSSLAQQETAGLNPAPEHAQVQLILPRLGGGMLSLASLRGTPVLLTLFTTWCLRCQAEAPWFIQLDGQYRPEELVVVGIALDRLKPELIQTYVQFVGFHFDVLIAQPDDLELIGAFGRTEHVPRTILLDRRGHIVLDQQGQTRRGPLEKKLRELQRVKE